MYDNRFTPKAQNTLRLAQAAADRLAQIDPDRFGQLAERLRLKARRAAQRKNKNTGNPGRTPGKPVQYNRKKK